MAPTSILQNKSRAQFLQKSAFLYKKALLAGSNNADSEVNKIERKSKPLNCQAERFETILELYTDQIGLPI